MNTKPFKILIIENNELQLHPAITDIEAGSLQVISFDFLAIIETELRKKEAWKKKKKEKKEKKNQTRAKGGKGNETSRLTDT